MLRYPVVLERDDNGTVLVSFPDVPEAHTFGDDKEEALARAVDALLTALEARIAEREQIPTPSVIREKAPRVQLPALAEAKIVLYRTMRAARMNKTQLARKLNVHLPQVDRLIDLRHHSRLDQIEAAFGVFGCDVSLCIAERPTHVSRTAPQPRRRALAKAKSR
jgi:antitoxin HicB